MRPFFTPAICVIFTALTVFSAPSVFADVDPEQVAQAPVEDSGVVAMAQAPAAPAPAADAGTGSALGQFGRAETAPAGAMTQNVVSAGNAGNFPKVMNEQDELMARKFQWWPTDAQPAPYKDPQRTGYWWWPTQPGESSPASSLWGNQGYIYVRKIIFDYKETEGPMKPSLVIKRIIKNVKVYFDYDKSDLREDGIDALQKALFTMRANPNADILITGNADTRGSEQYNQRLGERRASAVEDYLTQNGLAGDRIRILSRGKLDALAPTHDIVGMQKDRNAQFMIAEVEEVMIPAEKAGLFEDRQLEEKQEITGEIRVSTKEYTIQSGDTLWGIAEREYGDGKQWKRLYEFNQDVIANPNRPKKGTRIQIPIE